VTLAGAMAASPTTPAPDPAKDTARIVERGGRLAWSFVGLCVAAAIVLSALAVTSSVVLPLFLAVVLAVVLRPLVRWLERHHLPAPVAAGLVVVVLLLASTAFIWAVVVGLIREADDLLAQLEAALTELDVDEAVTESISTAVQSLAPVVAFGFVAIVISSIDTLSGFIAGVVLGVLILYYMLRDGGAFLRAVEQRMLPGRAAQLGSFVTDAATVMRRYWLGRTIVSAVVASVVAAAALVMGLPMVPALAAVTFVGGYIPYFGAFIGGLLAVIVAIGEDGLAAGIVMLLVVLVANLVVENMVDPHVTGRTLRIHPLAVLLVTTLGGVTGGLVGLMMAVPMTVIVIRAVRYFRAAFEVDADAVRSAVRGAVALSDARGGDNR
jgi:predicted PurR-regulated permease PerM